MGLFGNNDAFKALKEKGYSVKCYGETENTKNMSQFVLFYRVAITPQKIGEMGVEGTAFTAINEDLFEKGLVPASVRFLNDSPSDRHVQVIAKRNT